MAGRRDCRFCWRCVPSGGLCCELYRHYAAMMSVSKSCLVVRLNNQKPKRTTTAAMGGLRTRPFLIACSKNL